MRTWRHFTTSTNDPNFAIASGNSTCSPSNTNHKRRLYLGFDRVPQELIDAVKKSRRSILADKFEDVDLLFIVDILPFVEKKLFHRLFVGWEGAHQGCQRGRLDV